MARPVIALLTDFGLVDHYVAAMKGVMLGICPDAAFIDISHEIPPQDILAGALELEAVAPYLPAATVVVAVVDPGVGSARRGIAVEAGTLRLVGPDNGLFSLVGPRQQAVELREPAYARPTMSRTFEGRDRFAPAAAWLAAGVGLSQLGPSIDDTVTLDIPEVVIRDDGSMEGTILRVDRFGNLVSNITRKALGRLTPPVTVVLEGATIAGLSTTYAERPFGSLCALIGSTDRLEISVNGGSAAAALGATRGTRVQVRPPNLRDTMPGTA
jgi:S-adenosylmethionine hydrolase